MHFESRMHFAYGDLGPIHKNLNIPTSESAFNRIHGFILIILVFKTSKLHLKLFQIINRGNFVTDLLSV